MDIKAQTLSGVQWSVAARAARQAVQIAISILLARLLVPEDFGLIAMIMIFTNFARMFGEMGFSAALIQREDLEERHLSSVFWLNLLVSILLMVALGALAPLIARFYEEPRLVNLTVFVAISFPVGAVGLVPRAVLTRHMNFRTLAVAETVALVAAGALAVIMALRGYGVWALAWHTVVLTACETLALWWSSAWRPRALVSMAAVKDLFGYSANQLGFTMVNYWIRTADNLIVGKVLGSDQLGIYSRAYTFMLMPIGTITQVLSRVMFPAFSRIRREKERMKRIYLSVVSVIALFTFPMMIGLCVVADVFVLALLGPQWEPLIPVLRVLSVVGLVQSIGATTGWIYMAQGRTDWMFWWGSASGAIMIAAYAIGVSGGLQGVAVAYALSSLALTYFNFSIPGRLIDMTFSDVVKKVAGTLASAAIMGCAAVAFRHLVAEQNHMVQLLATVLAGVIVYALVVHFFRVGGYPELRNLVQERLRRPA